MLTKTQIKEIREHLEKAQNPLFFFDNDNDGLTSFLLLRRFIDRGRGIAIKSYPELNASYYRRIKELNPDYIFILDKPVVSQEFLDKVKEDNIPIVWIDHHETDANLDGINYYNPLLNKDKKNEPVSYLSYHITTKKEDIWLATIGCVSDCFMPDFYPEFLEKYPELGKKSPKSAFDVLYNSEIGNTARILDFSLKDTTTNVVKMLKFMMKIKSPFELIDESNKPGGIFKRFNEINTRYQELLNRAKENIQENLIYFQYGGDISLSANLSNKLSFEHPDKYIIIANQKADFASISLRGDNVRDITLKAIKNIEGATGGGHRDATGAKMNLDSLPEFKKIIKKLINEKN